MPVHWKHGWEPTANGRALPPRPTLLVGAAGDVEACRSHWEQLKPVASELLRRAALGCASGEELEAAVRRFRSLRESLVAAYVQDELAVQVYEASADVCLAAHCWPEFLKSVSGLTAHLYPAQKNSQQDSQHQEAQHQRTQHQEHRHQETGCSAHEQADSHDGAGQECQRCSTPHSDPDRDLAASSSASAPAADGGGGSHSAGGAGDSGAGSAAGDGCGGGSVGRRGEMHAAHCLFLATTPAGRLADAVALLRSPQTLPYLSQEHMQYAVKVLAAMSAGDWHSWLRLRDTAPAPSLRAILDTRVSQVRTAALRCLSVAFRTLPAPATAAALHLPDTASGPSPEASAASAPRSSAGSGSCSTPASNAASTGTCGHACGPSRLSGTEGTDTGRLGFSALPPLTHGSEALAALRAALEAASAAGVKGAATALDGLSAWAFGEGAVGDLVFRS